MEYILGIVCPDLNTLRPGQNGRHFPDDIFKCIFLNESEWISIRISLIFVPKGQINNIPSLFQIMAWRRPGDKPLSEAIMVSLLTHVCVTRPQWVNTRNAFVLFVDYNAPMLYLDKLRWIFANPFVLHVFLAYYYTDFNILLPNNLRYPS